MRLFAIIIGVIMVAGTAVYAWLGGFKQPVISKTELPDYLIAGKFYQGKSSDAGLGEIYYEIKNFHDKQQLPGILTATYYKINSKVKDTTQVFLGVILKDSLTILPKGYEYRKFARHTGIRATINCHPYVMPRPENMQIKAEDFAKKEQLSLGNYVMEKYIDAQTFEVELPLH